MASTLLHSFVSGKVDDPDTTLVRPSNWNAPHVFTGGVQGALLSRTTGEPDGVQWTGPSAIWDQALGTLRVTSLRFQEISALRGVSLAAPPNPTDNHVWTLPTTLGAAGTVLTNNGAGVLDWLPAPGGSGMTGAGVAGQVALWTAPTVLGGDAHLLWGATPPPPPATPVYGAPTQALLVGTPPQGALVPGHLFVGLNAPSNAQGMQAIQAQVYQGAPGRAGLVTLGDDRVGVSSWNFRSTGATNPIYGANFGVVFNTDGVANGLEIDVQNDSATNFQGQALWLNGSTRADGPAGTVGHRANAILIDTQDGSKWEVGIKFKEGFVGAGATGSVSKHGIHFEQAMDSDFIVIQPRIGTAANVAMKLTNPEFTTNRFELLNSGAIRVGDTMTGPAFPSYAFVEDQTSGIYMEGPSILGFSVSGTVPGSDPPITAGIKRMTLGDALNLFPVTQTPDNTGTIKFWDQFSAHSVGLMAQDFVGNNFRIKLPNVPGAAGQCLTTSGPVGSVGAEIETWSYGPCGSATPGGAGTVTNAAPLGANQLILGMDGPAVAGIGTLGTSTTVLHGNAGGAPVFSAVNLTTDVSGRLPLANFALAPAGAGVLLGRGSGGGAGDYEIITLGANLTMTGTTLAAAAPGAGAPSTARYWTATADAGLSAELNLGALTTGLVLNTVSGGIGTPSAYTGTACVGQFVRSLDALGAAVCAPVALATDVTGDLAFSSLAQGSALSVLGVAGNAPADVASIAAGTDGNVLRRVGTALGFGAINLSSSNAVSNRLPYGNLPSATAGSILVGRSSVGIGDWQEITLGPGLAMSGTVLNVAGGVGDVVGPAGALDSEVALFSGATGKLVKRATGTGPARLTAGVLGTGLVSLSGDVTGDLPLAGVAPATAASLLLGRGAAAGAGDWQELTLGANLVLTGTILSAAGGAPTTATYITATAAGTLPNSIALGALANGLLLNTTTTGVPTVYAGSACTNQFVRALSGSGVATCAAVGTTDVADAAVTFAKLQDIASARLLGRITAATGDVEELTGTQATTLLDPFTSALKGLAPASGGGAVNFLRADGAWAAPAGLGNVTAGTLTTNALVLGSGPTAVVSLGSLGSATTVLHGGAGAPSFSAVVLTTDVSGRLPYANLTASTAASRLFGRGASGAGDWEEIILGANLSITANTLNAAAGGGGAPITATYITQTPDATLVSEQALSLLTTGYMLSAFGTGVVSTQTATQVTASLDLFTSALKGLVPLSGGGTTNFLRADGNWAAPGGGGNVTTGTLTTNTIPRASGATAIVNSLLSDVSGLLNYTGSVGTQALKALLTNNVNMLVLGTTNTMTVTMAGLSADRTFTLPNANSNSVQPLTCGAGTFVSAIAATGLLTCTTPAAGAGTVTHTAGVLTVNQLVVGNATDDVKVLGTLGTTTTVLHGNAAGLPTFGAVALTADVTGRLPYANLTAPSTASRLLGRGDTAGDWQEVTLGANLTMTGAVLSAAAATGAPATASYWTATAEAALSAETNLGALTTGLVLNTVAAGVGTPTAYAGSLCTNQFVRALNASGVATCATVALATDVTGALPAASLPAHTGDVTSSAGSAVLTIAPDVVTFAKMQNIATARFVGRITTATGDPEELTGTQATGLLDVFTSALKGLTPASAGGTTNFLRADGTWAVPASGAVTAGAALDLNQLVIGQGASAVAKLGTLGTASTVLHGNAGGAPTFAPVALATDVAGRLAYSNLTAATAASRLVGRTDASAGDWQEIVLGANLTMVGTTLNAAAGTGAPLTAPYWTSSADAALLNEVNMGGLTTGLVLNTVAAGVGTPTAYGGTFCTSQFVRALNASGVATCASIANADLANSTITVTGTANRIVVTGSPVALGGAVAISTPQDIHTGAAPTFSTLTLSANANELTLGTTNTTKVTMATLTAPRIFTLPDADSNPVRPFPCAAGSFVSAIASSGILTCTAGATIAGTAVANQVAFFTGPATVGGSPELLYDPAAKTFVYRDLGTLVDGLAWSQGRTRVGVDWAAAGTTTVGSANEFGTVIQTHVAPTGSGAGYEKAALLVMARTNDPSTALIERDAVGIDTRGIIAATNPMGRAWGLFTEAIVSAGGDGTAYGAEINIANGGSDEPAVGTAFSKYGVQLVGQGPVTAGIVFTSAVGPVWHKGIVSDPTRFLTGPTDHFIEYGTVFTVRPDGATKIGSGGTNITAGSTMLSVGTSNSATAALVRLESSNVGSSARTPLALVRSTTGTMDDGMAVRQDFILRDSDLVDNVNARFTVARGGADGTGIFFLQTAIGGVLAERVTINQLGQFLFTPTPTVGTFALLANGTRTTELQLYTNNNTTSVGFVAPPTSTGNHMWRLPSILGAAGSVLSNDGVGNLTWAPAGAGAVTTTGTPLANQMTFFTGGSTISGSPNFAFNTGTGVLTLLGPGSLHVGITPFGGQAAGPIQSTVSNSDNTNPYQTLLGQIVNGSSAGVGAATTANDKVAVSGWAHRGAGGTSPIYGGNFTVKYSTTGPANGLELGVINVSGVNGIGNGLWINGGIGGGGNHRDNAILIDTQDASKWTAGIRFMEGNTGLGATGSILSYGIIFDKSQDADFIVIRPRVGVNNPALRITDPTFAVNRLVLSNGGDIIFAGALVSSGATSLGAGSISVTGGINTTGNIGCVQYFAATLPGFSGTKGGASCIYTITGGIITNVTGC